MSEGEKTKSEIAVEDLPVADGVDEAGADGGAEAPEVAAASGEDAPGYKKLSFNDPMELSFLAPLPF